MYLYSRAENPVIVDKISNNVDSVVIVSSDISKQDASPSFLSDFLEILKQYKEVCFLYINMKLKSVTSFFIMNKLILLLML